MCILPFPCRSEPPNSHSPMDQPPHQYHESPAYTPHNDVHLTWTRPDAGLLAPFDPVAPPLYDMSQPTPLDLTSSPPSQHPRTRTKKSKAHKVPQRGPSYTAAEDKTLTSAYLNISRDPIVGANQPSGTYWERISTYFHENNPTATHRSLESLQHRWGSISKDTSRFCAFLSEQQRRRESGKTDDDRVIICELMYCCKNDE